MQALRNTIECSISEDTPVDPVIGPDGQVYNREDLTKWYDICTQNHGIANCPINRNVQLTDPRALPTCMPIKKITALLNEQLEHAIINAGQIAPPATTHHG